MDINPVGGAVVVGQARFRLFIGEGEPFHQAHAPVHVGEPAAAVFEGRGIISVVIPAFCAM